MGQSASAALPSKRSNSKVELFFFITSGLIGRNAFQRSKPGYLITIGGAAIILPPWTLLRVPETACARDVVVNADLDAAEPEEVFLSHVSASAIEAVCLLMVDSLDLETLMKVVQDAASSACKSSLRDAGANEWCNLAFRIENSQDGVASTFPTMTTTLRLPLWFRGNGGCGGLLSD